MLKQAEVIHSETVVAMDGHRRAYMDVFTASLGMDHLSVPPPVGGRDIRTILAKYMGRSLCSRGIQN